MTIDICGWIEVKNENSLDWEGKVNILEYLITTDIHSSEIFGINKYSESKSIAGYRGLPEKTSKAVEEDLDSYREFEKVESNFSFEELFGFSYLTYDEILSLNLIEQIEKQSGWFNVFELMALLHRQGFDRKNVRVIVWAHW